VVLVITQKIINKIFWMFGHIATIKRDLIYD
jgi:hypothetical protein